MDTTDPTAQDKGCLDCSVEELGEEGDVTEASTAPEQKTCCQDEPSAAGHCDQEVDEVLDAEGEPSIEEGIGICTDAVSAPAADKDGCFRFTPHDFFYITIFEVSSTEIELSRQTVVPQEVIKYYEQFGLDERIIQLLFQLQPPAIHPGNFPGISG